MSLWQLLNSAERYDVTGRFTWITTQQIKRFQYKGEDQLQVFNVFTVRTAAQFVSQT